MLFNSRFQRKHDRIGIIKYESSFVWFGLYSVCVLFVGVHTSIKSTKLKFIPVICNIRCPIEFVAHL